MRRPLFTNNSACSALRLHARRCATMFLNHLFNQRDSRLEMNQLVLENFQHPVLFSKRGSNAWLKFFCGLEQQLETQSRPTSLLVNLHQVLNCLALAFPTRISKRFSKRAILNAPEQVGVSHRGEVGGNVPKFLSALKNKRVHQFARNINRVANRLHRTSSYTLGELNLSRESANRFPCNTISHKII